MLLRELNSAPAEELDPVLLACCDVPAWATAVREGRPYVDVDAAVAAAEHAARLLTPGDVDRALAAHPRIGERPSGSGVEAGWSRQEQASADPDEATRRQLAEGNRAYEERFGRVFLICASGLPAERILAALRERLTHDEAAERVVVAEELRRIAVLRLRRLLGDEAGR